MPEQLTAISPGKLILSGEHAVVYGQPALAIAIERYTTAVTTWHHKPHLISFKLLDLRYAKQHTLDTLDKLKHRLQDNYNAFLQGKANLCDVLKKPFELLQYSVSNLLEKLNFQLPRGVEIKINSEIPIGCGMGSSAAAIMSALHALINLFKLDVDPHKFLKLALEVENLQHGKSSGLDLHLAAFGGGMRYQAGKAEARAIPEIPMYMVNTGVPAASTGECVQRVKTVITQGSMLEDFATVTNALDCALQNNSMQNVELAIKENHRLLDKIGVVPQQVAKFVADIEAAGGAAKVCGAGSICGNNAGMVIIVGDDNYVTLSDKYGYKLEQVRVDYRGTRIV